MKKSLIILSLIFAFIFINGCNKKEYKEIGHWETQNVRKIYNVEELKAMSETQRNALTGTYIKVKTKFSKYTCKNELYYMIDIDTIAIDGFFISAISYANYWELTFAYGDEIYIEGYVYYTYDSGIQINPAHITHV